MRIDDTTQSKRSGVKEKPTVWNGAIVHLSSEHMREIGRLGGIASAARPDHKSRCGRGGKAAWKGLTRKQRVAILKTRASRRGPRRILIVCDPPRPF